MIDYETAIQKCRSRESVWYTDNDGESHEATILVCAKDGSALIELYRSAGTLWVGYEELEVE